MKMTLVQQSITIGMVVLGTLMTRFLPFVAFPSGKPTPRYIQYLGKVLPAAVFAICCCCNWFFSFLIAFFI